MSLTDGAILVADLVENLFYENYARLFTHPQVELIPQPDDSLDFSCLAKVKTPLRTDVTFKGTLVNGPLNPHLLNDQLNTHISNGLARLSFKARGIDDLAKTILNNLDQAFITNFSHHLHQKGQPLDISTINITITKDHLHVLIKS